jgi:tRNA(fMet)-specific endonuclease VapC
VGFLIDSSVLIAVERGALDKQRIKEEAGAEHMAIAAITASELLHGVHRAAASRRRQRREAFVEALLGELEVLPFNLKTVRTHAAIWADLAAEGQMIGAHDLLIAATALSHDLKLATRNLRDFERVEGLQCVVW